MYAQRSLCEDGQNSTRRKPVAVVQRFGIPNIHLMFEGDVRVLEQIG